MSMSFQDVERLQALYPENQIELRAGKLITANPSDGVSGVVGVLFPGWEISITKLWPTVYE